MTFVTELHNEIRQRITAEPQPVRDIVAGLAHGVDFPHVVAALWDVIEDDDLIYDALATVYKRNLMRELYNGTPR